MKILVFLHGTTIMHKSAAGQSRTKRVKQVIEKDPSVREYASYIPTEGAMEKLNSWYAQGAQILYLSSHESADDVVKDKEVLNKYSFPPGDVLYRRHGETYADIAERVLPDVLIEDDCESIGGVDEMTLTHIQPAIKKTIKSWVMKEFDGIDGMPDDIHSLLS